MYAYVTDLFAFFHYEDSDFGNKFSVSQTK